MEFLPFIFFCTLSAVLAYGIIASSLDPVDQELPESESTVRTRNSRSLKNFAGVMACALKKDCTPDRFYGYGCYCGLGGSGDPVDYIDTCCQLHDQCYDATSCNFPLSQYATRYEYDCSNGVPSCRKPLTKSCDTQLCECDRHFAECLRNESCPVRRPSCPTSTFREKQSDFLNTYTALKIIWHLYNKG